MQKSRGKSDQLLQPSYNWLRYQVLFATTYVLMATEQIVWQKSSLSQGQLEMVALTPLLATKSSLAAKKRGIRVKNW